jgi:uncharacterized protein YndB with AHSA1/START domain
MTEIREAQAATGSPLVMSRTYATTPEHLFDAWVDPEKAKDFLFATPDGTMQRVEIDPRVGGRFRIDEQRKSGLACHYGEYLAIDRPRRLVFGFTTDPAQPMTEVAIAFEPADEGSRLTLSQVIPPQWEDFRDRTRKGWTMILDALEGVVDRS